MKRIQIGLLVIALLMLIPAQVTAEKKEPLANEVIYDIVVDRFNNMNQQASEEIDVDDLYAFHGGDLQGIIAKLDELQSLGFTTLSLSPIMENAAGGFHGYWIEDHFQLESQYGTMDDLQQLIEEAHQRDMKIFLEYVPNYVATSHPITSEHPEWIDEAREIDENKTPWLANTVVLDQEQPEVRTYLEEVAMYWINETGIDGFKIHEVDQVAPSFLKDLTASIKENDPNFLLIGTLSEQTEGMEKDEIANLDYVENNSLQQAMSDVFSQEAAPVSDILQVWEDSNTAEHNDLIAIDDKFTKRFTHQFTEEGRNLGTAWKLALTYIYTTPGVPFIYQGSEIPMYGEKYPETHYLMQFNSGEPEIKEFYTRIASLREEFPALRLGDMDVIAADQGMSVYKREYKEEILYIAINNDVESRVVTLTDMDENTQLRGLLGDNLVRENQKGEYKIGVPRESTEVYLVEKETGINWLFILPMVIVFALFVFAVIHLSRKEKRLTSQE